MRSIQGFARFAIIPFHAQLLVLAIELIRDIRILTVAGGVFTVGSLSLTPFSGIWIGRIDMATRLACAVAFLIWFFHAYRNIERAAIPDRKYSSTWAVVGFLVPFLNLAPLLRDAGSASGIRLACR